MSTTTEHRESNSDFSLNPLLMPADHVYLAVLNVAIELNLFEIISKGCSKGMSSSEIASQLPNPHASMAGRLDRMLFLLSNYSLLTCSSKNIDEHGRIERVYALTNRCKYLISDEDGASCVRFFKFCYHPTHIKIW